MSTQKEAFTLTTGPSVGMNDVVSLGAQDTTRAEFLQNVYAPQAVIGGDLISRPGYTRISFDPVAGTGTLRITGGNITGVGTLFESQLSVGDLVISAGQSAIVATITTDTAATYNAATGTTGSQAAFTISMAGIVGGPILGLWQHTRTDATYHRLLLVKTTTALVSGGAVGQYRFLSTTNERIRLVEYNPSATTYQVFTDMTSSSMDNVALDTTTRIYANTFANYFVLKDEINRPRKVDLSSAPYALTNLSDGNYAFYGPESVYYGKEFFVDANDRVTLRWSEENDPDTGYGTGTSPNSWTLRQTSADQIEATIGTNAALYVFRQNSATSITGAANTDFASAGTLDDVSTTIGTRSPDSVCNVDSGGSVSTVFVDQYGRPGRVSPGYGYLPLYDHCLETIRGVPTTVDQLRRVWTRFDGALNLVKIGYPAALSSTSCEQMLVFDARTWECMGIHQIPNGSGGYIGHDYAAVLLDENLYPRFTVASGQTNDLAIYVEQTEMDPQRSAQDVTATGVETVPWSVTSPKIGGDPLVEKRFKRLTVGQRNIGGTNGLSLLAVEQRDANTDWTAIKPMSPPGGSYDGAATKAEYGINRTGRWCQFRISNAPTVTANTMTRGSIDTITVQGSIVDDHPSAR